MTKTRSPRSKDRDEPNPALLREFEALLERRGAKEGAYQTFLEEHTAFIETPELLHNRLGFNSIISKLSVGPWKTDFAYLSYSSLKWRVSLVELEHPAKKIFKKTSKHLAFTSEFNDAVAQIDIWRARWETHRHELVDRLRPLLVPDGMSRNPITAYYVLIIGRDDRAAYDEEQRHKLAALFDEKRITVLTYDTLLRTYRDRYSRPKCVLSPTARGYRIKYLEAEPSHLFSHVHPNVLDVPPSIEKKLVALGYSIPEWRNGELLRFNGKWPLRFDKDAPLNFSAMARRVRSGS